MSKKRYQIIGLGPLFEDSMIVVPAKYTHEIRYKRGVMKHVFLEAGIKEKAAHFQRSTGGSSANLICALSKLGNYRLGYFTKIGFDAISDWLLRDLQDFGVNTDGVIREEGEAGASIIVTDPTIKDRSIISYRGLGDMISGEDVERKKDYLCDADWHNIDSFTRTRAIKAMIDLLEIEKENGIKLFFTPSMSMISAFRQEALKMVRYSSVLSLNDVEAMELSGSSDVVKAAATLKDAGPDVVFVTLGKDGILAIDDSKQYRVETYPVEVVNTVGAGDLCAAVFWDGLYRGVRVDEVLQRASAASSIKVQTAGAKKGLPTNEKIDIFLEEEGKKKVEITEKL